MDQQEDSTGKCDSIDSITHLCHSATPSAVATLNNTTNRTLPVNNHDFSQLNQDARKALDALGISSEKDLINQPLEQIWADFEKLSTYFPEHQTVLNYQQLEKIYTQAQQQSTLSAPIQAQVRARKEEITPSTPPLPVFKHAYGSPLQRKEEGYIQTKEDSESEISGYKKSKLIGKQNKSHAQRCRKSFRTYFMALLTVFMTPLFILSIVGVVVSIFTGYHIPEVVRGTIAYAIVYGIFLLIRLKPRCQVCRIQTFALKDYPHNKHAHNWLFFGYNYSTAFHIIFCFWFRCPACGTAVQLFKPKRKG